ncbi:MAG: DUF3592 domain-containing protein [Acidobacteria bacterium]|nr:DUF3592 domain-containing protein [Acidobacteriota bacterium]
MLVIRVISSIFILVGIVLLAFGASALRYRKDFIARASPARGTITEVIRRRPSTMIGSRSSLAIQYYYKVRYETHRGESTEFVNSDWQGSPEYAVGQEVPVLYHPGDPGKAAINSFSLLWFNSGFLGVLGACLLGAGACNLWITASPARGFRNEVSLQELKEAFRGGRLTRDSEYQGLLVALSFVGFALLGVTIMTLLFASATVKFILATLVLYTLIQAARGRRRRSNKGR